MKPYATHAELLARLREIVEARGQKAVAEAYGFSPQFINDVLRGRRDISNDLAEKLGFTRAVVFFRMEDPA